MASEDFVIDIGLRLNDKEARAQVNDFYNNQIKPLQTRLEKVQRGTHDKLIQDFVNVSYQYQKMMGGAVTPAQAVRYAAGGTPTAGTAKRLVVERAEHELRFKLKQERETARIKKEQEKQEKQERERLRVQSEKESQQLQTHLGKMDEQGPSPVEKVWQFLDEKHEAEAEKRMEGYRAQRHAIVAERDREEAKQKHQEKILEIIAKNTGVFKKWGQVDKAIVQREQRSILSSLKPGQELTDYQQQVLGVGFGGDLAKKLTHAGSVLAIVAGLAKLAYNEATREASLFNKQASVTGYSLPKERLLSRMGVSDPASAMSDIATFYDRARLGELPFEGFGMFAPQTYATRMKTRDPLAIWRAFKADVAAGEAKGWSRETIAQKTGMQAWLPTLNKTEAQVQEWAAEVESGKYQDERAQVAYDIKTEVTNIREMLQDARSKHNVEKWIGAGLGLAAGVALAPVTGGTSIPAAAALFGSFGTAGAVVGANAVPAILEMPDVAGDSIKSDIDALWNGRRDIPNVTLNMTVDREVVDEINNGGKYTRTFSGSQISELY